ncbi:hypothetical protein ACJMK2_010988 [Sinanodonta woodiana]|uniref:Kazal-like domain-containing protein n=1 Tax=Sinanodonta woodiana TaxID=1069815 RepID=A0ABD3V4T6_SINWO
MDVGLLILLLLCYFAQAYCHDTYIHVTHAGPCVSVSGGGTTHPVDHVTDAATTKETLHYGPDAVLDFFCIHLSHENCTLFRDEICGSDNITYLNPCEFEKERCSHRDLHVMHFGIC